MVKSLRLKLPTRDLHEIKFKQGVIYTPGKTLVTCMTSNTIDLITLSIGIF